MESPSSPTSPVTPAKCAASRSRRMVAASRPLASMAPSAYGRRARSRRSTRSRRRVPQLHAIRSRRAIHSRSLTNSRMSRSGRMERHSRRWARRASSASTTHQAVAGERSDARRCTRGPSGSHSSCCRSLGWRTAGCCDDAPPRSSGDRRTRRRSSSTSRCDRSTMTSFRSARCCASPAGFDGAWTCRARSSTSPRPSRRRCGTAASSPPRSSD